MKAVLLTLALVAASAAPAAADDAPRGDGALHVALGAYMTLNGVDLAETMYLLGSQQGHEANRLFSPFSSRPVLFGAMKMGIDSAAVYGILRIRHAHPRLAWVLTGLGIAAETAASVHNARLIRR